MKKDKAEFYIGGTKIKAVYTEQMYGEEETDKILNTIALLYKSCLQSLEK